MKLPKNSTTADFNYTNSTHVQLLIEELGPIITVKCTEQKVNTISTSLLLLNEDSI